jgi:hypothetical protein
MEMGSHNALGGRLNTGWRKNWIALRGRRGRFEHCSLVITHWKVLDGLYDLEINGLYSQILFLICKLLLTLREFTLLMQSVIAILGFASLVPTSATATISSIRSRSTQHIQMSNFSFRTQPRGSICEV